jgi:phage shock protein A
MNFWKMLVESFGREGEKEFLETRLREAANRIATLEIQCGRIKEERDAARAHLKRIRSSIAIMT